MPCARSTMLVAFFAEQKQFEKTCVGGLEAAPRHPTPNAVDLWTFSEDDVKLRSALFGIRRSDHRARSKQQAH